MEETAESRWRLVKQVIEMSATPDREATPLEEAAVLIRAAGIETRMHTGMPPEWFNMKTMAEWLLGSYLDIVEQDAEFAVDPWLSVASERLARAEAALGISPPAPPSPLLP